MTAVTVRTPSRDSARIREFQRLAVMLVSRICAGRRRQVEALCNPAEPDQTEVMFPQHGGPLSLQHGATSARRNQA